MVRSPADAGSSVAACRFEKYVRLLHLRKLFADYVGILTVGYEYDIISAYNRRDALNSELKKAFACAEEIKKLFRTVVTAEGPES